MRQYGGMLGVGIGNPTESAGGWRRADDLDD